MMNYNELCCVSHVSTRRYIYGDRWTIETVITYQQQDCSLFVGRVEYINIVYDTEH